MTTNIIKKRRLSAKQEAFIVDYVLSPAHNITQSAIKAGYSQKTAYSIGSENLSKPEIIARRAELEERIAAAKFMPEEERRRVLATIARETHFQPVTAGDRIRAVDTLNKLDKLYADEKPQYNDNRQYNIVIQGAENKSKLEALLSGERPKVVEGQVT